MPLPFNISTMLYYFTKKLTYELCVSRDVFATGTMMFQLHSIVENGHHEVLDVFNHQKFLILTHQLQPQVLVC